MSKVAATGVPTTPGPDGSIPIRHEIRDLQYHFKDHWNLYLLGLVELQKKPPTDILSYYQLAGIHGEPFVPWNDVSGNDKAAFGGYGIHSSSLLLTWNRPYLALYEQVLYSTIQEIASKFPESMRARYTDAAKNFRMPYWDWAAKISNQTSAFPTAVSAPTISIIDVDGATKQIPNPLFSFRFDDKTVPEELKLSEHWSRFPTTIRSPDRHGHSRNSIIARVLANENASLRSNVCLALLSCKNFEAFSKNQWLQNERPGDYGSIENIHNGIHDRVGQAGHMGALEVASFDPVFWLHHANVDRLWAIWQALHPDAYSINHAAAGFEENYHLTAGQQINANTDLKPFYDPSTTKFWTSSGVRHTTPFGYAYPETQTWLYSDSHTYQAAVRNQVTQQYGANLISNFFNDVAPSSGGHPTVANVKDAERPIFRMTSFKKAAQQLFGGKDANDASNNEEHVAPTATPANEDTPMQIAAANLIRRTSSVGFTPQVPTQPKPSVAPTPAQPAPAAATPPANEDTPMQLAAANAVSRRSSLGLIPQLPKSNPGSVTAIPLNVPEKYAHLVQDRTYTEWITTVRASKRSTSQTFRVYVFLGDFRADATDWPTEHNVVGRFTALGRGVEIPPKSDDMEHSDEFVITGTVPLTTALLQDIVHDQLASLAPSDVEAHLSKHLHWRVTGFDGSEKSRDEVPGLKVGVVSTKVKIGDDGVPVYSGVYEQHVGVTEGRPGGFGNGDKF